MLQRALILTLLEKQHGSLVARFCAARVIGKHSQVDIQGSATCPRICAETFLVQPPEVQLGRRELRRALYGVAEILLGGGVVRNELRRPRFP